MTVSTDHPIADELKSNLRYYGLKKSSQLFDALGNAGLPPQSEQHSDNGVWTSTGDEIRGPNISVGETSVLRLTNIAKGTMSLQVSVGASLDTISILKNGEPISENPVSGEEATPSSLRLKLSEASNSITFLFSREDNNSPTGNSATIKQISFIAEQSSGSSGGGANNVFSLIFILFVAVMLRAVRRRA
ncbi:hypothetical protein [Veronia nyctiphanis]|uniref:hypothetical protein n=1 Tax=Veronia nyctiphanis TaxID=1278244 RepID=UPI0013757A24|nr:hypothetical protein [Veronia nyctiphanis]